MEAAFRTAAPVAETVEWAAAFMIVAGRLQRGISTTIIGAQPSLDCLTGARWLRGVA